MKKYFYLFCLINSLSVLTLLTFNQPLLAEEGEESKEPLMYYRIDPNILTFYQNTGKKLGYVVVQIHVSVRSQDNYDLVEFHLPLIQDALIDFFNRQDTETIKSLEKREELRQQATTRVAEVLKEETNKDLIEEILFTQYIFQ